MDQWKRGDAAKANGTARSLWQFTGTDGKTWNGMAGVETLAGEKNAYGVSLKVVRSEVAAK